MPNFEGPLDLLLYLIRKHELDILDLPIAFVTERYVEYMRVMETLNLDIAAEYLVMAATLAHIKSKSLLPKAPEEEEDLEEDGIDPREDLIRRLLAYQKYKNAAEELGSRGVAGRDVFPRGIPAPKAEGPAPLADVSVFKLIDVFQKILERHEGKLAFEIDAEQITIQERMGQITEMVQQRERLPFEELFEGYATTYDLVVSFLALLEMAKMRLLRIFQAEPEGPIYLEARVVAEEPSDEEVVAAAMRDDIDHEAARAAFEAVAEASREEENAAEKMAREAAALMADDDDAVDLVSEAAAMFDMDEDEVATSLEGEDAPLDIQGAGDIPAEVSDSAGEGDSSMQTTAPDVVAGEAGSSSTSEVAPNPAAESRAPEEGSRGVENEPEEDKDPSL